MGLPYGNAILESEIQKSLQQNNTQQNGIRTWKQLFGNASIGNNANQDNLKSNYADAIAEAYKANLNQKDIISSLGLSDNYLKDSLALNRRDLESTYDTYLQNYRESTDNINRMYETEYTAINSALSERVDNFAKLYNYTYDYLNELKGYNYTREGNPIYDKKGKEKLTTNYLNDYGLDWTLDKDGNLLSQSDMLKLMTDDGKTLNERGVKFYDQIFNATPQSYKTATDEDARSFDEWLSGKDADLREWWLSPDAYNYTRDGRNVGTANVLTGRESTDTSFKRSEYNLDMNFDKDSTLSNVKFAEGNEFYDEAIEAQKNAQSGFGFGSEGNAYRKGEFKKANKAWIDYQTDVSKQFSTLDDTLRNLIGTDLRAEFTSNNKALYDELDAALKTASKSKYADEKIAKQIQSIYKKLYDSMKKFVEEPRYTGKISGR